MWILPKNYQLSSAFAADMVASKEDLTLPGLNIESSLMSRSKPSPLRTWLTRWKTGSYLPHLYTRILKPSHRKSFEEKLASSLAGIHANLSQQQVSDSERMTPGTCGPIYGDTLNQLDLFNASLKTSRDTSRLDSPASSAIWKKMVIDQRGEYSQRVKLAHHTRESECISWGTPAANDANKTPHCEIHSKQAGLSRSVGRAEAGLSRQNWPTPTVGEEKFRLKGNSQASQCLEAKARKGELDNRVGQLNPDWVEQLMGVPPGWTSLDGTSNEWINGWHDGSWEQGIPRVVDGCDNRVDRIRCLGNGVVPQTAAKAYTILSERLI